MTDVTIRPADWNDAANCAADRLYRRHGFGDGGKATRFLDRPV